MLATLCAADTLWQGYLVVFARVVEVERSRRMLSLEVFVRCMKAQECCYNNAD